MIIKANPAGLVILVAALIACTGKNEESCTGNQCPQPEISITVGGIEFVSGTSEIDFGSVHVGDISEQTVAITNSGEASLSLGIPASQGQDATEFLVDADLGSLAAGTRTEFRISFAPKSPGQKVASIRVTNNDQDENPFIIKVGGHALEQQQTSGFPLDLQGSTPEELTATISLSIPNAATTAKLQLIVFDAENPQEGFLYINSDDNQIELFGSQSSWNNDATTAILEYETPLSWWQNGINTLRFVHTATNGFRIDNAAVDFDGSSQTSATLLVSVVGNGTVTSNPAGIQCGIDCQEEYVQGTDVVLTAEPAAGWFFSGFSGACSGDQPCAIKMDQNKQVGAQFLEENLTGVIQQVGITPGFETAGIILTLDRDPSDVSVALELKEASSATYQLQHPPYRYDARHVASSFFYLKQGRSYDVRIRSGQQILDRTFTTREEIDLPQALRVVSVSTSSELTNALSQAQPGDEIRLAPGSYNGSYTIRTSGTAQNPIVITGEVSAADQNKPIEQRTELPLIHSVDDIGFFLDGVAFVVLENIRIANCGKPGIVFDSATHCVLQHSQVYDNDQHGAIDWSMNIILEKGGTSTGFNIIQDNHIADLSDLNQYQPGYDGKSGVTYYGIWVANKPGPGHIIRRNRIEGFFDCLVPCPDERDDPGESSLDALAQRAQSSHTVMVYDNGFFSCRDDGIESDGFCVNAQIFRNWFERTNNAISIAPALPGPYFWLRNRVSGYYESAVKHNTSSSVLIRGHFFYHNTFEKKYSEGEAALTLWNSGTDSKDLTYRNNIFTSPTKLVDGHDHDPDMDGDLWFSPALSASWLLDFQNNYNVEANGIWGDPGLGASLEIDEDSPAANKALLIPGINDLYSGNAPDIGAHEAGGIPER